MEDTEVDAAQTNLRPATDPQPYQFKQPVIYNLNGDTLINDTGTSPTKRLFPLCLAPWLLSSPKSEVLSIPQSDDAVLIEQEQQNRRQA